MTPPSPRVVDPLAQRALSEASATHSRNWRRGVVDAAERRRQKLRYRKMKAKRRRRAAQAANVGKRPRAATSVPWNALDAPMKLYCCASLRAMLARAA